MNFKPQATEVLFVPLGGSGEIGSNLNLYGHAGKWLMVDCGVSFGDDTPGIELTLPDPDFITQRARDLVGIVVTHGHEDHIGALEFLWDRWQVPVYATPFTANLIRAKLGDARVEDARAKSKLKIIEVAAGKPWQLGPFGLEFVHVTHSIPDSAMLVINTAIGQILHTGDWKFDAAPLVGATTNFARLKELGAAGVLCAVGDSTNAMLAGRSGSEQGVQSALVDVVCQQKTGRIAITCFASNVARLHSAAAAAKASGRDLCFIGRSLWRIYEASVASGYWQNLPAPLTEEEAGFLPPERALYVVTGSQGEARAALARIAQNDHPEVVLEGGDTVIFSAREIPGNEKEIARVQNQLLNLGVKIITADDAPVHVSGHPAQAELTELYQLTRPKMLIPVHGELRHQQAHVEVGKQCQVQHTLIPTNGSVIRITSEGLVQLDQLDVGKLALDGKHLIPLGGRTHFLRNKLANMGAIMIALVVDRRERLATSPAISLMGVEVEGEAAALCQNLTMIVNENFNSLSTGDRSDDEAVKNSVAAAVKRHVAQLLGKKPLVEVQVLRVNS